MSQMTTPWIKQILAKEKRLLKMKDVRPINPPRFDEISVKNLYEDCLKLPNMSLYFPDRYPKGRQCCRKYFFDILNTLHPDYTRSMIINAKKVRVISDDPDDQGKMIVIDPEWEAELKEFP